MTELDDNDALAAEYVLGTLDAGERSAVAQRLPREPALASAVGAWEQRLGPMSAGIPAIAPPPALKAAILARLAASQTLSPTATILTLNRRVSRWRSVAAASMALAASLAGLIVYRESLRPEPPGTWVAVLQKDAASPAFLMRIDVANRTLTVQPVSAKSQAGHSYELWLINEHVGAPRSLGVVGDEPVSNRAQLATYRPDDIETATYAITLEPEGGSPTGKPTGAVLFVGKLQRQAP